MKKLTLLFFLSLSFCANAAYKTIDLDWLDGQKLNGDIESDFGEYRFGDNFSELDGIVQLDLYLNIEKNNLSKSALLAFWSFENDFEALRVNKRDSELRRAYSFSEPFNPDILFDYSLMGDWDFRLNFWRATNDSMLSADDYIVFGPGSYLSISDTEGEIFDPSDLVPVPETGTFALFLLGAVGLCVRRQMKQQA